MSRLQPLQLLLWPYQVLYFIQLETVYKPCRQLRGRGVAQMSTLLNKSYLVKVSTKGEGGQKCPKFCLRGLYTAPDKKLWIFLL